MIGRTLDGRYAIVRLLGQGGMGAVYEARHTGTGRRVAVKVILGAGAQEQDPIARFQREARAVGAVESDHIAQVFDTGRDPETGAPYIAMEFLEGEDVQTLLDRLGPLPVDLALRIALQACLGLERAHAAGVIHRDVKPANLFVSRKEQGLRVIKLLDFGVAKITGPAVSTPGDHALTKTGAMMGSPLYMSPEQARGAGAVDARSDLWSLGITLYQCISGRRPNDDVQGLGELLINIVTLPAPWLQSVAPWVPAEVAHVVRRALTIVPADRYADAGELSNALKALLPYGHAIVDAMLVPLGATTRSYVAPQAPALASSSAAPPTTFGTTGHDPRAAAPAPRRPLGLIAGGAVALMIGGAGVVYSQRHRGAPAVAPSTSPSESLPATSLASPVASPPTLPTLNPPAPSSEPPPAPPPASAPQPTSPPPTSAAPPVKRPGSAAGLHPFTTGPQAAPKSPVAPPEKVISDDETSRK